MTTQEIYDHIRAKVFYTKTNGIYIYSEWNVFKPESLCAMIDIRDNYEKSFELQIEGNKFRIRQLLK